MPTDLDGPPEPALPGARADEALSGDASGSVIRGAIARGGLYVVSTGLIAVAFAFVFRDLGREAFGLLSIAIAIGAIGQNIGDTAVSSVSLRLLVAAPAAERPALSSELVGFRFILMPAVGVIAVLFGLVAGYSRELVAAIAVVCGSAAFTAIAAGVVAPLSVEMRVARASLVEFARQVAIAAGLLVAAAASFSLVGYSAIYLGASVIAVALAFFLVDPAWRRVRLPSRRVTRLVGREAAWLALAVTVNSLFLKVLVVVASLRTSEAEVGLFGAATRVTEVVAALSLLMASVAYPLLSRAVIDDDHDRFANALHRVVDGALLLIGAAVIVLVVCPGSLMQVFAGPQFEEAAPVLQIQAFALLAAATTQALIWALLALRAERTLVLTNLLGLVALLALGIGLIGAHGARGAALAAIGGEIVLLAVTLVALGRLRRSAVPPLHRALRSLALTGSCVAIGLILPLPEVAAAVLALVAFGVGGVLFGVVPDELLAPVASRLRRDDHSTAT